MLMGAVVGFVVALLSGSLILGFVLAIVAGILMSLIFAAITMELSANQVATGLALTIFGTGLSAFIGADFVGKPIEGLDPIFIPLLTDLPLIGRMIFGQDLIVYLSFVLFGGVYWFIKYSRPGLILKAVGENPHSANAIGLPVLKTRYLAIMFGGAMAGLAGSYLSLAYTPLWAENMSAGRGWIALALVVFASWKAERVLLGAWLFGLASILHLVFQGLGFAVSPNLLAILPYLATVVVLVILSSNQSRSRLVAPMSLGKAFYAKS